MTKAEANAILNAAKAGFAVKAEDIRAALVATGDLSVIFVRSNGRANNNAIGPCRMAVYLYLLGGGSGSPREIAEAIDFPLKATEHALRKLREAGSPLVAEVRRAVPLKDCGDDFPTRKAGKRFINGAIANRTPLERAWH